MNNWRLIFDTDHTGPENMALDYALLKSVAEKQSPPVLRFYGWANPAITIGYFQSIDEETNRNECRSRGVEIIRRITGGGAVFHADEITYSIVIPSGAPGIPENINDSYPVLLAPIVDALRDHSVNAVHVPINDILVDGKKISGSAQVRRDGVLLQHGTIILDMDIPAAFRCLTVPESKNRSHGITDPEERITTLRKIIGAEALTSRFRKSLREEIAARFAVKFSISLSEDSFSENEHVLAETVRQSMFSNAGWNESRKAEIDF
ncbi:MAG TPA: lipoate--protein ligase family protein [Spirochaetota bacterium]|nr:lipoate--protein ligase family protein [Spirochaetota bacterium]